MTTTGPRDVVLLLTHSGDFYTVDLVFTGSRTQRCPSHSLQHRSVSIIRQALRPRGRRARRRTPDGSGRTHLDCGGARRLGAQALVARMADDLDERYRSMCAGESVAALEGFLDALHDARWVNIQRQHAAENKRRSDSQRAPACAFRALSLRTTPPQLDSSSQRLKVKR